MGFQDIRIRTKLVMIMVATGMLVLTIAMIAMVTTVNNLTRQAVVDELHALTAVISWNSEAALAFDDSTAARQTIAALGSKPSIAAAYLYDTQGALFSSFVTAGSAAGGKSPDCLDAARVLAVTGPTVVSGTNDNYLHVVRPVMHDGERLGTLHIIDDLSVLDRMAHGAFVISLLIILVALALVVAISSRLQRIFSEPVHQLIQAMNDVAGNRNYATRVVKSSRDEFGDLVDVFNEMLTEIEERDTKLAGHGQRLEFEVAERTTQLEDAVQGLKKISVEAVEAREAAEAASQAKSEFLATMSHEIRTPMNGVLGMAELLTASGLSSRQAHFARTIQNSGNALLDVINNILDFSKIESGMLQVDQHDFHLGEMMEDLTDLMFEQVNAKGLEITLDMPTEVRVPVRGDSHRLRQVLVNLVGNAIKFTSQGRILIRVQPAPAQSPGLGIRCEVIDTGIGIAPEARQKIFEAFAQADGSTTRCFGGTGLGLAISRQLVELMGGQMGVDSELGQGSTFWFELSLETSAASRPATSPATGELTGYNLLVVDDSSLNCEILTEFAASWGMATAGVADGEAALQALADGTVTGAPWDAILLDLHLPGRDGISIATEIRQMDQGREIPLVMLSSVGTDATNRLAQAAGVDTFMSKPVRKAALRDALAVLLQVEIARGEESTGAMEGPPELALCGHVLVAEDNPVNQDVVQGMLEHLGLETTIVENGEQAVAAARERAFSVILMDCHMPGMDGFAATTAIRQDERKRDRHTPIIALTANVQKEVEGQCTAAGMDGYLSKPFTWNQLTALLEHWLTAGEPLAPGDEADPRQQLVSAPPAAPTVAATVESAADPAQADNPLLDLAILGRLRALQKPGRPDIVAKVIGKYADSCATKGAEVQRAISSNDPELLTDAAHFLKSSSANLGAMALADMCRLLEGLGRQNDMAAARELSDEFEDLRAQTVAALLQLEGEPEYAGK